MFGMKARILISDKKNSQMMMRMHQSTIIYFLFSSIEILDTHVSSAHMHATERNFVERSREKHFN